MTDQNTGAAGSPDAASADVDALRTENEVLRAQIADQPQTARSKGGGWRSVLAWILAALAVLSIVLSVFAVWLKTTIADEDRFVETFVVLPQEEAVVNALSVRLAEDMVAAAGVEATLNGELPPQLSFLAAPVTQGVNQLASEIASEVIGSDIFSGIWRAALRVSHKTVTTVLETEGRVVLDLDDAAQNVADALADRGVTAFEGQDIDIPEIVLFENEQIAQAAAVVNVIDTIAWFLPLLSLLLLVGALWLAPDRRKMVAFVGFGTAFALILDLVMLRLGRSATVSSIQDELYQAAAEAGWDTTLRFYTTAVWAFIALALVVGTLAWVLGPSERAQRVRGGFVTTLGRWSGADSGEPPSGFETFVTNWKSVIQWGAVLLGLLFILFGPTPTFGSVVVTALVVLVIFGGAQAVAGPDRAAPAVADDDAPNRKVGAGTAPPA